MAEQPNVILAILLATAATAAGAVAVGLALLGGCGVAGVAAMLVGVFSVCVVFLDELKRAAPSSLVLLGLALASLYAGLRSLWKVTRAQRFLRRVPLEPVRDCRLVDIAQAAGVRTPYVNPAGRPAAFCYGLLRPRVVVTAALLARLRPDEQAAAVWHEAHHARAREPLKCMLARLAASTFFWLPALGDLLDRYLLAKELAADRLALRKTSRAALAGALYEVVGGSTLAAATGLSDCAAARVDRLFDPEAQLPLLFRRCRLAVSAINGAGLVLLLLVPGHADLVASEHLREALSTTSLHGWPGIALGLLLNAVGFASIAIVARWWRARSTDVRWQFSQTARKGPIGESR